LYALCFATGEGKIGMDIKRIDKFEGEIANLLAERRNLADGSLPVLDFVGQEDWIETSVRISAIDYRLNRIKGEIFELRDETAIRRAQGREPTGAFAREPTSC
jgi:hypothetical protein